jgi:penicillin-binding protein 2
MSDNSRVRVTMIGVVIVALFSALVARLWFLQMGPDAKLAAKLPIRTTRQIQTDSPRGRIFDRTGRIVLAQDKVAWAVTVDRDLPPRTRKRVIGQLSELLGVTVDKLQGSFDSKRQSVLKPAVVALDVSQEKRLAILERQEDFPGVGVTQLWVRTYPAAEQLHDPTLAAQVLGFVGEIDDKQLKQLKHRGYLAGDDVGKDGVEAAYESVLRGKPTIETVEVDPTGKQVGEAVKVVPGSVGHDVYLTLDARIQKASEDALADGITAARTQQDDSIKDRLAFDKAPAGAVVVLDTHDGSVVAMASNPAFPPSAWAGGVSQQAFNELSSPDAHNPLLNRATEGLYAPGSAFKLVTTVASTRDGVRGAYEPYLDTGSFTIGNDPPLINDGGVAYGSIDLQRALAVSSDTYFYSVGDILWNRWRAGDPNGLGIQQVAREFGFGSKTGIELSEAAGRIPDPKWKQEFAKAFYKSKSAQQANGVWYPGDNVHLAVGQGDTLVTPLQLADAYAGFANGGNIWTPHIGLRVVDPMTKKVVRTIGRKARSHVVIDPMVRAAMTAGFDGAVHANGGTATGAFQGLAVPVSGKTGTAQVYGKVATSVFASYFPSAAPRYVVVAMVEEAGHGADIAAPIVRQVIEAMNGIAPVTPIHPRTGQHD